MQKHQVFASVLPWSTWSSPSHSWSCPSSPAGTPGGRRCRPTGRRWGQWWWRLKLSSETLPLDITCQVFTLVAKNYCCDNCLDYSHVQTLTTPIPPMAGTLLTLLILLTSSPHTKYAGQTSEDTLKLSQVSSNIRVMVDGLPRTDMDSIQGGRNRKRTLRN